MIWSILAWAGLIVACVLTILGHPKVFFGGRPIYGPLGAFYELYFLMMWLALGLAAAAAVGLRLRGSRGFYAGALLVAYLVLWGGVPHRRNRLAWCYGKLGLIEYLRAEFSDTREGK
ncbi:MAG: hypothetical protein SFV54_17725 [Bryobacteraceae bacterium]|nr:hypothetical protein [Bryobacteraceae bacterium]